MFKEWIIIVLAVFCLLSEVTAGNGKNAHLQCIKSKYLQA